MKKIFYVILTFILWSFIPQIAIAENHKDSSGWSYSVEDGIEKSKRSYLLVSDPQLQPERRITVVSQCQKPCLTEGTYGKCVHDISIQPTNITLSIVTGEDIVIVDAFEDILILGTIQYGCCTEPDVIRFYSENGKYIGRLDSYRPLRIGQNIIRDGLSLTNSTGRHENVKYLVVQDDEDNYKYYAWIRENKNELVKVPILFSIPNREACGEWYLKEFTKYIDRQDITMTLEGRLCETQNRAFDCHRTESNVTCSPSNKK
ncbi:MAG: hypothetical protein HY807_05620 [Nitrospirae bacterium]|nr:hypothetical protein [Nitrospirota bacterium]